MVGVVVDPLVEEVVDGQESDLGMIPAAGEISSRQSLHQCDACGASPGKFRQELDRIGLLILALTGDGRWVPGREPGSLLGQDRADAAGEATLFRLDQVTDHLQNAPLLGSAARAAPT